MANFLVTYAFNTTQNNKNWPIFIITHSIMLSRTSQDSKRLNLTSHQRITLQTRKLHTSSCLLNFHNNLYLVHPMDIPGLYSQVKWANSYKLQRCMSLGCTVFMAVYHLVQICTNKSLEHGCILFLLKTTSIPYCKRCNMASVTSIGEKQRFGQPNYWSSSPEFLTDLGFIPILVNTPIWCLLHMDI
jgi:hypothetical protein